MSGKISVWNKVNKFNHSFRFVDLFSGIGAFHQVLSRRGGECVFACDIDPEARAVYEANYGVVPHGDIRSVEASEIPAHDVLCAGFPCQAFSAGGHKAGFYDPRGTLFFDVVRIAKHHRPKILLLENVKNLLTHDKGETFAFMKGELQRVGYRVFHKLLDASDFGTAQQRKRVFLVCVRTDLAGQREFQWPKEWPVRFSVRTFLDADIHRPMTQTYTHENEFDGNADRVARVGRFGNGTQGYRVYSPDGLGVTLCSGGGGAGANTGVYLVDGVPRTLTANECRKLSNFPDDFKMHARERRAIAQFGNAIPLFVLDAVVQCVLKQFAVAETSAKQAVSTSASFEIGSFLCSAPGLLTPASAAGVFDFWTQARSEPP